MESIESTATPERLPNVLERATKEDIPALIAIEQAVAGAYTYSAMLTEEDWLEEFKNGEVFLIKSGDRIVGSISLEHKGSDHLYISGVVVLPEFQGRGIAKEMLNKIISDNKDVARIDLLTHPDNPALALYQSLGFVIESRQENVWGEGQSRLTLALNK